MRHGLRASSPLSHARERRRPKRSGGKEFSKETCRLAASPLDFTLAATLRVFVLQREPARRLYESCQFVYIEQPSVHA